MAGGATTRFLEQLAHYRECTLQRLLSAVPEGNSQPYLYGIIRELLEHPGKGFRPALCLATCGAFGGRIEDALNSAAALEMLHNAFLVHDDVEDYSEYRHSQPTVHARYGMPLAVNTGDAMQALSMRLLRENNGMLGAEISWYVFEEFDHLLLRSLEGQAMELGWVRQNECSLNPEDYVRMVLRKTCWYSFIHPCRVGALVARRSRNDLDVFNEFGYYLGAAFQIRDDILNLTGTSRYGKEAGGDLYEGKRTLMLLHLLENSSGLEQQRLRETLGKNRQQRHPREIAWVWELMQKRGSLDYARAVAAEFLKTARQNFDVAYSSAHENEHKGFVRELMNYVLEREF